MVNVAFYQGLPLPLSGPMRVLLLNYLILVSSSIWFDTMNLGFEHIKGSQVRCPNYNVLQWLKFFVKAISVVPDEMPQSALFPA